MPKNLVGVRVLVLLAALAALMVASIIPAAAQSEARVRVLHASPDAPAVDIFVDGNRAITNLAFPRATDYVALPAGQRRIQVAPTGQAASAAVIDATVTLTAGRDYTVAAVGQVAQIRAQVYEDNNAAPAAGQAHVRVIHASPNAPAVDVAVRGGPVLISNLAFPNASQMLPVAAGTYNLDVRAAGTQTVALPLNNVELRAGTIYTVVATGLLNGQPALAAQVLTAQPVAAALPRTGEAAGLPWLPILAVIGAGIVIAGVRMRRAGSVA
jgi:hypothetical protein